RRRRGGRVRDRAGDVERRRATRRLGRRQRLERARGREARLRRVARTDPLEDVLPRLRAEGADDQDVARRADVVRRVRVRVTPLALEAAERDVTHLVHGRVPVLVDEVTARTDRPLLLPKLW